MLQDMGNLHRRLSLPSPKLSPWKIPRLLLRGLMESSTDCNVLLMTERLGSSTGSNGGCFNKATDTKCPRFWNLCFGIAQSECHRWVRLSLRVNGRSRTCLSRTGRDLYRLKSHFVAFLHKWSVAGGSAETWIYIKASVSFAGSFTMHGLIPHRFDCPRRSCRL